jgi:hypothetical protein
MNDSIDEFFEREREAVPLLAPPTGRFEELQTVARRRRNRNTTAVSAAAAVVLAVVGTGAVLGAQNLSHGSNNLAGPATSSTSAAAASSVSQSGQAIDPAVPADFKAWSVTFYGSSGWALGGYTCSDGTACVAVLETTDSMRHWHTIAEPAAAGEYGMTAKNAIVRFVTPSDGWMVGSEGVYSSHDGGVTWRPVAELQSAGIDALEAHGSYTYALGRDGSSLWVSGNPRQDQWVQQSGLDLPTASTGTEVSVTDSIDTANRTVAATRITKSATTVRLSPDNGQRWTTVQDPCTTNGGGRAEVFGLLEENIGRFVCTNGEMWAVWFDHSKVDKLDGTLPLSPRSGNAVVAQSLSTNNIGTVVAYSGAGLVGFVENSGMHIAQPGDFRYVGLTDNTNGIALPDAASGDYWVTGNGGLSWMARSFG